MKEENKNSSNQQSNWQKYAKKRWFYPAVYLVVAALVITVAFWMQGEQQAEVDTGDYDFSDYVQYPGDEDATPVTNTTEMVGWPVSDPSVVQVFTPFYDPNSSEAEQEAAIVVYNNLYIPNQGIDLVAENGEVFDVVAAMSGTVTRVEKDDKLLGMIIEITHENNVVTHYHSLSDVRVTQGESVKQGMLIGTAGRNLYNQEAGNHVHFELRYVNGDTVTALNPIDYFNQPITSVPQKGGEEEKPEQGEEDEHNQPEEDAENNEDPNSTT
jgi:stage II sporulation protein Q